VLRDGQCIAEAEADLAAEQIGQYRSHALVGDVNQLDAEGGAEHHAGQML
jgi:hypothetical protein